MRPAEDSGFDVLAIASRREVLRVALPVLKQNLAEMEAATLQGAFAALAKGQLTPERAHAILSEVHSYRLLLQKFATAVEMED